MQHKRKARYRQPHELLKRKTSASESDRSKEARWGNFLAETGFTQIPNGLLDYYSKLRSGNDDKLSSSDAMLLIHLLRFKWDQNDPYPSHAVIAARMGLKVPAIRKQICKLEAMGYIKRKPRKELTEDGTPGKWLGNAYELSGLFEALKTKILEEQPSLDPNQHEH